MTYGTIKVDTVTFTNAGVDKSVTLSGLVQNPVFSGNVTVTGTLSGVTVTGTTANFTSGNFTNISGGTHTITSGVFAAGSAASPSITFTGDLNTGIYSPGADQVAISTGGSGRLFVDASGRVGVGGAPSGSNLNIIGSPPIVRLTDSGTNAYSQVVHSGTDLYLDADRGGAGSGALIMRTNGTYERLRITSAGLVGVGTSSPGQALDVVGTIQATASTATGFNRVFDTDGITTGRAQLRLRNSGGGLQLGIEDSTGGNTLSGSAANSAYVGSNSNTPFYLTQNATIRATIDTSGRLGVGTTSPGFTLDVKTAGGRAVVTDSGTGMKIAGLTAAGAEAYAGFQGNPVVFLTDGAERLRIDSSGRVGIGTSSPSRPLHVVGSAVFDDGTVQATIWPQIATNVAGFGTNNNYPVALVTNGSQRLHVTAAGNVGIGTTTPGGKLTVVTTTDTPGNSFGGFTDSYLAVSTGTSAASSGLGFGYDSTNNHGLILSVSPSVAWRPIRYIAGDHRFEITGGIEKVRIDSSGRVGIGTSAPGRILDVRAANTEVRATCGASEYTAFLASADSGVSCRIGAYTANEGFAGTTSNHPFKIETNSTTRVTVSAAGNVGIGTTSPLTLLDVRQGTNRRILFTDNASYASNGIVATNDSGGEVAIAIGGSPIQFIAGSTERARIDSSGRLLVGTSSAKTAARPFFGPSTPVTPVSQIEGYQIYTDEASRCFMLRGNSTGDIYPFFALVRSKGTALGSNAAVANGDNIGALSFQGMDGTNAVEAASIVASVDGTPGANDMPGRLVFSTTADGASSPTERMKINAAGATKISSNGGYISSGDGTHEFNQHQNLSTLAMNASSATYQNSGILFAVNRSANSIYTFIDLLSGGMSGDFEFRVKGDGNAYADGSWSGGGADYAEYFEWSDSNPVAEDRRGISVVLDGDKIREAVAGEDPIGVISGNPSVVGDAAWNKWSGKYLRDDFGTYIQEDYEVEDEDGNTVVQQRRKLNPAYDPDAEYISREQRSEWDCVGLMGKLRIRKGQITGSRWIKMRDISDSVEEWLVR